jgi:xanthine/CO dehydrogenase XdhC/CoxF family maturation factor
VNRIQQTLILAAAVALPAAAHSTFAPTREALCFASGATTYQIARNAAAPDFRIRIADTSAKPDLRMRLVDSAEKADFVLVDDFSAGEQAPCRSSTPIRTVALDADTAMPDVTVTLSADATLADYKIYVHSVRFSQQDAAALLAAMWKTDQRREATGSVR